MGMEVTGSDVSHGNGEAKVEEILPNLHEKENGKVGAANGLDGPIKFGSHGVDDSAKVEADNASNGNFPKNAAEEWPAEPQIHSFYIFKYRSYDDPNLKAKIDQADKEIGKRNQQRFQIVEGLKSKRLDRGQVISQLKSLGVENKQYGQVMDEKINQMKPLKEALGSLRGPNTSGREKGAGLCSSEEELNDVIRSLNYRMQHEVIPLTEEKQILRDIKQLEGTREKVIANAAMRTKIQDSLGQKDVIRDQVKLIGSDLDGVKKDRQAVRSKIKLLEDELKAVDSDINSLQEELASVSEKRDKAFETIQQLRKQRDEGNACFYQNRTLLNNAKELAAKKNTKALEELVSAEVEKFMSSWNSSKAFRDDYEKRILVSLDMRQLSRDGRMRNPNEKPLVLVEQTKPSLLVQAPAKPTSKVVKEDVKPPKEQESVPAQKVEKDSKKKKAELETVSKPQPVEEEEYFVVEKPKKEKVIDEAKMKEIKRQEEIEKQKQALERKKKLAEKNAAKAAIRAQKEAEKKEKKKSRRKEGGSAFASLQDETTENEADSAEAEESDKVEENAENQTIAKAKELKNPSTKVRSRGQTKRRDTALPKAILKRKKSNNYWLWAAPAAVAVLGVLLALLYKFAL